MRQIHLCAKILKKDIANYIILNVENEKKINNFETNDSIARVVQIKYIYSFCSLKGK